MKRRIDNFSGFTLNEANEKKVNRKKIQDMIMAEIMSMDPEKFWFFASQIEGVQEKVIPMVEKAVKKAVSSGDMDWVESKGDAKNAVKPNMGHF